MTDVKKPSAKDRQPGEAFAAWIERIGGTADESAGSTVTFLNGDAVDVAKKQAGQVDSDAT